MLMVDVGNDDNWLCVGWSAELAAHVEKSECIHRTFNDDAHERVKEIVLPGKGHSVLTLDFVDEAGHPTYEALQRVLDYFGEKLRAPLPQS